MLDYWLFKKIYELALDNDFDEVKKVLSILQEKYIALCDENSMFKMQLQELEDIIYLANSLVNDGEVYWLKTGSIKQGPFCCHCYETKGVLLRLYDRESEWRCYTCGTVQKQKTPRKNPVDAPVGRVEAGGHRINQQRKVIPFCR